jgi:hypothetical protein
LEEDRMPKKIFPQELERMRRRERPRKRWKEEVERDLPSARSEKMVRVGDSWKKWRDIVRQAKAHSGL